jgi:hypothetical protein
MVESAVSRPTFKGVPKMKPGLLLTIALCGLLAACGGGSSGGTTPIVTPTSTPITYAAKIVFTGALAGAQAGSQIQADLRQIESGSGTPPPIMVVSAPESGIDASVYGGEVDAVVSPYPSASPSVTFTQTNSAAAITTPAPPAEGQTPAPLPTGVIAQVNVNGTNAVQTQSAGTATATIGAPVSAAPTTPIYSYMSIALDCYASGGIAGNNFGPYAAHFGWQWTGTTWTPDDDVSTADIYIDGPGCAAPNPTEASMTVHVPAGDIRLTTDTPFSSVAASAWVNSETSFTILQAITTNPDGSNTGFVIGKTAGGAVFKLFPNALGTSAGMFGGIEVSGDSVDGF